MPKRMHYNRISLTQAVTDAQKRRQNAKNIKRLLAMQMASEGKFTSAQIAEKTGISRRQFFHWLNALKNGGVKELLKHGHSSGAPPRIKGMVLREFKKGLLQGKWKDAKEIRLWLAEHRVKLSLPGVYCWVKSVGGN